jgi:hypothetical protein
MQSTPKKDPLLSEQIACDSLEGILMESENRNLEAETCDCDHAGTLDLADEIAFSDMIVKVYQCRYCGERLENIEPIIHARHAS